MKKLLLAIYIILVVTASLASRAETTTTVKVPASIVYDDHNNNLIVTVKYPNPCIRDARTILAPTEYSNVFYIEVQGHRIGSCGVMPGYVAVENRTIDARVLKFELQRLNQDLTGTYTFVTRDGSFHQVIDFADLDASVKVPGIAVTGILLAPKGAEQYGENREWNEFIIAN